MAVSVISKAVETVYRLREKISSRGLILMYHSVADVDHDPFQLAVTQAHFADQMALVNRHYTPLSLAQLVAAQKAGSVPDRAIAITFDDGYANNLSHARPILMQYGIPATVFITSGYVGENREFWWDALDSIFLQTKDLPRQLATELDGRRYARTIANYHNSDVDPRIPAADLPDGVISRMEAFTQVWGILLNLDVDKQGMILDDLFLWSGRSRIVRETHRPLSADEIQRLEEGGLVEIGAHTVTHPNLPEHPARIQLEEIERNKEYLESILGHAVKSFSYPYGRYSDETKTLVKEAGFDFACAADGSMTWKQDPFRLPRTGIGNMEGVRFKKMVDDIFRYSSYPRPFEDFAVSAGRRVLPERLRHWMWNKRQRLLGLEEAP